MELRESSLVSVVVLNWNGIEDTKICLSHLGQLDYPNYEIIVVDNGSSKSEKDYLASLDGIIYIDNPTNRGFTGGHIDGFSEASGEFIVLMNNDAVMKPDYLKKAIAHFEDEKVAAVGGRAYFWNDKELPLDENNRFYSFMNIDIYSGEAFMQSSDSSTTQEVNVVSGSAIMVRRSAVEKVGYLHNRFFAYFEETDLFARMKRAGLKVLYDPQVQIWHKNGASSGSNTGSYFFYYQIFRNRFIFASRNFETKFLLKFWTIYFRLSFLSMLKWIFRRGDLTMNKAYAMASLYNILTLPRTLLSRYKLRLQLGKSQYNRIIYSEQNSMSVVIDCSLLSHQSLNNLVIKLGASEYTKYEFILVVNQSVNFTVNSPNVRLLVNQGYFSTHPINLGCIVAKYPWMLLCEAAQLPDFNVCHMAVVNQLGRNTQLIAFGSREARGTFIILSKSLFERIGGMSQPTNLPDNINYYINYASRINRIAWNKYLNKFLAVSMAKLNGRNFAKLDAAIEFDKSLQNATKLTLFEKIQNKYYRIYQSTMFARWLVTPYIPLRLKAGRIKNLITHSFRLNISSLALEFKHIRNEVLLYSHKYPVMEYQKSVVKRRVNENFKNPQNIPVFIICYERVNALRQLTSWLESKGYNKIVLIDNDSSYPPLLEFYKTTHYQVLRLNRNIGHTSPWTLGITRALIPDNFYIVSDPDVIPIEECPDDAITHFLMIHKRYPAYEKVGFGLSVDDIPDHYPLKNHVISWESQFWKQELEKGVFEAGLDTTFALYKPFTYLYSLHPSIRTGYPYIARHLPWYDNPATISDEERYYRTRANKSVNSWNSDTLAERYAKEMPTS